MRLFFVLAAALSTTLCATVKIHEKIIFAGVCKNTAKGFDNVKASIERLAPYFDDYAIIIYENNSSDNTVELYSTWAKANDRLHFMSETLNKEELDKISLRGNGGHIVHIARARQKVLDVILDQRYNDFRYVIMADLDKFAPWDTVEILRTIQHPDHPFDAVFANGSYDTFALRSPQFNFGAEHVGRSIWFSKMHRYVGFELKRQLESRKWLPVESGFGGLAIYQRESLKGSSYGCKIDSTYYEWMKQRPIIFEHLPQPLKRLCSEAWEKNQKTFEALESVDFDQTAIQSAGYPQVYLFPCEHIWLHYHMIDQGFDKMFINPRLKMKSHDHSNF